MPCRDVSAATDRYGPGPSRVVDGAPGACHPPDMSVEDRPRGALRVSDAERERAVESLRLHHAEGRLTFEEFTDRVDEAYRARSAGELDVALRELPAERSVRPPQRRAWYRRRLPAWWLRVNGICTAVWAATTLGSGVHYFWPMWVMLGTGIPVIAGSGRRAGRDGDPAPATVPPGAAPALEMPDGRVVTTVLFADIVASTERAAALGDAEWNRLLARYERQVGDEVVGLGGQSVFTKGDEVVAAFPTPAAAVRCGRAVQTHARALGLDVRAGVHAGEVDRHGGEVRGLAMHIGQRVCAAAGPGQLLVSSTVRDLLVGSGVAFTDAGEHELKGVPGTWRLFALAD